jgi:hypothetical protein
MKRTLIAICITAALAAGATAAEQQKGRAAGRGKAAATRSVQARPANVQRGHQVMARQNVNGRQFNRARVSTQTNAQLQNRSFNRNVVRENNVRRAQTTRNTAAVTRATNNNGRVGRREALREQRLANASVARNNNLTRNNNVTVNRTRNVNRNVRVVNNWRGSQFAGNRYVAFRNYHRAWHDRGWWDTHYGTNLTFVFGAPYFWSAGYWYPAWGYYPGYNYAYDGPIYGGAHLAPDQIVANVQTQLRDDGYYSGAIDGQLGPQTRQALAAFQADNGLAITSAVDEPTLATMGLS